MPSELLSARSYLEFNCEVVEPESGHSQVTQDDRMQDAWMQGASPVYTRLPDTQEGKLGPSRRMEGQQLPRTSPEQTKTATEFGRKDPQPDRPVRKRGRPRLETPKDAAAIEVVCTEQSRVMPGRAYIDYKNRNDEYKFVVLSALTGRKKKQLYIN